MKHFGVMIFMLCCSCSALACWSQDAQYFVEHPKALQQAIAQCPDKAPKLVTCEVLRNIAMKSNGYAYDLRMSPQTFGKTILTLQETIAQQKSDLQKGSQEVDLNTALYNNQQELKERLAIVNWLESPES